MKSPMDWSQALLPPLEPGIPRGRHADETGAGLQGRHPVGALGSVEPGICFPTAVAGLPVEVMPQAGREAIVNAVTHRDYASNGSVQVMLLADRLEIWNPGELPSALSVAKLHHPHPSLPRNPLIADPMFLTRYAEKAGSGILDMLQQCQDAGLREPEFRQDGGFFVQTMWRPKSTAAVEVPPALGTKSALSRHQVGVLRKCNNDSTLVTLIFAS